MQMGATVDTSAFESAVRDYADATGKTFDAALWRSMRSWALKAYKWRRQTSPRAKVNANVNTLFPAGKRGADWQWRLVEWLMDRDGHADKSGRADFAKAEKRARRKSAGFGEHLIMGLAKAAEAKGAAMFHRIHGAARVTGGGGLSSHVEAAASSVYNFESPQSRARVPRDEMDLERALVDALNATAAAQVADMEAYIARKLQEAAK